MFMADLYYIFILHYQVIPKIACVFSKPYKVWFKKKKKKSEKSKSNMTVSNISPYQALHSSMKLLVICSAFSMLIMLISQHILY